MKESPDALDPEDLIKLRNQKLRRQVRYQLYAFSPFYRRVLGESSIELEGLEGLKDLPRLPLVDRSTLGASPDEFVLRSARASIQRFGSGIQLARVFFEKLLRGLEYSERELRHEYSPVHILETTGTVGEPVPIRLTRRDLALMGTLGRRMFEIAGAKPDMKVINLIEPSSAGGFWPFWLGGMSMGLEQVAPGYLEPEQAVALAWKLQAEIVVGRWGDVLSMLEAGAGALPQIRLVVLAPEPIPAVLRQRIQEAAGDAKIIETYGCAEGRSIWPQCFEGAGNPGAGFHSFPDFEVLEGLSPFDASPARQGQPAEVAITGLDHRGTALARYLPGDVAMGGVAFGRCPYCGRVLDRVLGRVVRRSNLLNLQLAGADPLSIDMEEITEALAHPRLRRWQLEVQKLDGDPRGADEVYVLFEPRPQRDPGRLAAELDEIFNSRFGFSPTQFVLSERAEGGVVDLRQRGG